MTPPLGDFFPKKSKEVFLENKLVPGAVFKIFSKVTTPPKEKFIVIIGFNNDKTLIGHLFVNTKINTNISFSPELKSMHLSLSQKDYSFLRHNSYLDCTNVHEIEKEILSEIIEKDISEYKGNLNKINIGAMKYTISHAITIPLKIKKRYGYFKST